ncbi:hypothetical protein [Rubripirellula reticaptiva]|uniref:Glycosyltransferase RgtA/B/C/D-like domain-containing protein n=1 Tax=Rubripirellula reticaptiva TaxID=2528013 RepID=A0A5C6EKV6_9BACT|nr:hypothetical protein [Rubripirellula reticaptiva]TWU49772.1 hypothetical protein Poly59_43970 [Rubripirellula reticaptiva]
MNGFRVAEVKYWVLLTLLMLGVAAMTGHLQPHHVDDTPSYLQYPLDSMDAAMRSTRTPGYPLILVSVSRLIGIAAVPWIQILLHSVAAWWLGVELRRWGTRPASAIAAAIAVAFGCTFMDHVSTIATDAPAASLGVMTAVAMMRWVRLGQTANAAMVVACFSVLAISFRPAYLALAPWTLLCGACFRFAPISRGKITAKFGWLVAPIAITTAIVTWIMLRGFTVGDFGVLPFGHQNLAGITVQLASDDELLTFDGAPGKLIAETLRQRDARIAEGLQFTEGNPSATMTIEGRWNDLIYQAVVPASRAIHGDDTITNHNAIAAMNKVVIRRYPMRYARWLALAARRAAWASAADIVMHPVFLAGITLAVLWEAVRVLAGFTVNPSASDAGLAVLFIVGFSYFVVQIGFVILTSPPLGRFADAVAILIPAWIAARIVQHFQSCSRRKSAPA